MQVQSSCWGPGVILTDVVCTMPSDVTNNEPVSLQQDPGYPSSVLCSMSWPGTVNDSFQLIQRHNGGLLQRAPFRARRHCLTRTRPRQLLTTVAMELVV